MIQLKTMPSFITRIKSVKKIMSSIVQFYSPNDLKEAITFQI